LKLQETIQHAIVQRLPLKIVGGGSKSFYGRTIEGLPLELATHRGIISYEPSELVVTARAGTPLHELESTLAERGQCLAFEPPYFGETATWGGTVACGLSGPARPYLGAMRDFILGIQCLTGKAEVLNFGGRVMKNVAGYDVSRLMVGALGTLGILLEISCKVMPLPPEEITLVRTAELIEALEQMISLNSQPIPLTATCFDGEQLFVRLSGIAINSIRKKIGWDEYPHGDQFWKMIREQQHPFFTNEKPLWRLSVPPTTPPLPLTENMLVEWGGALRWLYSDLPATAIREMVTTHGGHATLFKGGDRQSEVFQPLPLPLAQLQHRLKEKFDPYHLLNPHLMFKA